MCMYVAVKGGSKKEFVWLRHGSQQNEANSHRTIHNNEAEQWRNNECWGKIYSSAVAVVQQMVQ